LPEVYLENLTKKFSDVIAIDNLNLRIFNGEILTLLGPSGCGKTTTLRCIAGFLKPDKGNIYLGNECITNIPPEKRKMAMVFQNYALWPHMNVFDNIAFGLKVRKFPKEEIRKRVKEILEIVKLSGLEYRFPRQLSGGQQQRVALARALVIEPEVLLLDEPLSNLDAKLREEMRFEIKELQRRLKITTIYVTHDQAEALVLSDRIAIMNQGKLMQVGLPQEIYDHPENKFVAGFIGLTTFVDGIIKDFNKEKNEAIVETKDGLLIHAYAKNVTIGQNVTISIRPEHVKIFHFKEKIGINCYEGIVSKAAYLGNIIDYRIKIGEWEIRTQTTPEEVFKVNEKVIIYFNPNKITVITI
jgi:spermidine/putrescine ABC transporter ATP-binding subunit